ncbi:bifunctional diguanylate cyclase/phosphodiesterase [Aliikangiella sp. G2MR2-5]|uniref:putative bifunctional diguanylate cyclase/phosphodiesterase n=1 Tax=Aliikangiella sp. G2MR2-5 TaxID=2788943 RepID=UPI0018A8D1AF|nr:bifunctional diguanylate cyclase/phosphodiesterase [Aliikangiella sp. G2MR2-5]
MTELLLIENCDRHYKLFKKKLLLFPDKRFNIKRVKSFSFQRCKKTNTEAIIYSLPDDISSVELSHIRSLIQADLNQPIILLTREFNARLDHQLLCLGIDDCLPFSELTPVLFERTLGHALQRKSTKEKLAFLSTHDQLTGLSNRFMFQKHLEHTLGRAKRDNFEFAIIFLDIDRFKVINESAGHEFADNLLVQIAARLNSCIRETDIIARFGNDEFAILLENYGESFNLAVIAEKIQYILDSPFIIREQEFHITSSMGMATFPQCGTSSDTLLKSAETALRLAKTYGRNRFHILSGQPDKQAREKLKLENDLRRALINGEFVIYLQPQFNSYTTKVSGAEALLRWRHSKLGMISPPVFIPMLEELGLLAGIEAWVLNQVCHFAKKVVKYYGKLSFSVNISGTHFKTGNLKENIYLALQDSSLAAENLEVELTEDIMIEHVEKNSLLLNELKELGISIALDDFGKGYSSLSYLKNFPADVLKIDKAFIDNIVEDKRDRAIVDSLIDLAHKLDIKVVAEGVEKEQQVAHLKSIGCDLIQGFLYSKPLPFDDFENLLKNQKLNYKSVG